MSNLHPQEVTGDSPLMERVYKELRLTAWREQPRMVEALSYWRDEIDSTARHWVIVDAGIAIASARLSFHNSLEDLPDAEIFVGFCPTLPTPIASINRLVVHPDYRRRGYGTRLDNIRLKAAEEWGCQCAIASSTEPKRIKQLADRGFKVVGTGREHPHPMYAKRGRQKILVCLLPRD